MDQKEPVIVGIDLGAKSIGWAVMACGPDEAGRLEPLRLLDAGARCFEAGVDGNIEAGKDEARAVERRMARGTRRQLYRRAQRLRRTVRALAESGLLPAAVASPPEARHQYFSALDERLKKVMLDDGEKAGPVQDSPIYQLRRRCLQGVRSLEEIGRAFFHLAQRRGFKSNRKDTSKDNEKGAVKSGIKDLKQQIKAADAPTLGAYFATLDPHQTRIRSRWTARSMYEDEFWAIWAAQAAHHPAVMTYDAMKKIYLAIFHQRPLQSSADLIGFCELEPQHRRAPMGCLVFQRFRIVQKINDLTWRDEDGVLCGPLKFDDPRRRRLIDHLDANGDMKLNDAKTLLGLHKKAAFTLEEGAAKTLPGNRTVAKLKKPLGSHWDHWNPGQREMFVNELISDMQHDVWQKRLVEFWGLSSAEAEEVADLGLQDGYASLSRRAIRRLLPEMEAGVPYATAKKNIYGDRAKGRPALDALPGVLRPETRKYLGKINNPAVVRALTELRKVVNAITRKYGKPVRIRIELARDIRNTRKQRQAITEKIKERTEERETFRAEMARKLPGLFGGREPSRADVEKWALAEECNWNCPYTGRTITPELLFGAQAQFDVEHIIPRSRRPDDSFTNKTLCHADENRASKNNQTPYEAYHGTAQWDQIIARVKRFQGPGARAKLRLFEVEKIDDDFTNRDLNDTRYASRLAKDYLGLLYGGGDGIDATGTRCVQACCGGITATLRNELGLNNLLSDDGEKNRQDHRHHAVDAVAIALAGPRTVQLLATAAGNAAAEGRRRYAMLPEPWSGFWPNVEEVIGRIVVSHRVNQTLSGALHQGTNFSLPKTRPNAKSGKADVVRHVRKKLIGITKGQIENIVDPRVKKAVVDFLAGRDPKVFKADAPFPTLANRKTPDRPVPIRRVRVWEKNNVISVGAGGAARHVAPGENNHLEIVAAKDKHGNLVWDMANVVSRFEATRRLYAGEPVVTRNGDDDYKLVMVLRRGDCMELEIDGTRQIMRVVSIGVNDLQLQPPLFGAPAMEKQDRSAWRFQSGKRLQAANPRKVSVSPIGEVKPCNE